MKKLLTPRSGDEGGTPYKSSWAYFYHLMFLKDQFRPRLSTGNLRSTDSHTVVLQESESEREYNEETESLNDDALSLAETSPCNMSPLSEEATNTPRVKRGEHYNKNDAIRMAETSSSNMSPPRERSTVTKKRVKRGECHTRDNIGALLLEMEEKKIDILSKEISSDSDEMKFFETLIPHMQKLTLQNKLRLQMKLQETVYNFVYGGSHELEKSHHGHPQQTRQNYKEPPATTTSHDQPTELTSLNILQHEQLSPGYPQQKLQIYKNATATTSHDQLTNANILQYEQLSPGYPEQRLQIYKNATATTSDDQPIELTSVNILQNEQLSPGYPQQKLQIYKKPPATTSSRQLTELTTVNTLQQEEQLQSQHASLTGFFKSYRDQ